MTTNTDMQFDKDVVNQLPESAGVYLFKNANGRVLYVGKAKNLKKRVASYLRKDTFLDRKTAVLVRQVSKITIIKVESEFEALLLESKLIRKIRPKYNIIWKDDKHYIYIKISGEEYPRILFSRKEDDDKAIFFGPFPSSSAVREILPLIRRIFPYCNQKRCIKKTCFYTHIGLCDPCPAIIDTLEENQRKIKKHEYLDNIRHIKLLLSGKLAKVKSFLEGEMRRFSAKNEFEKAALYKNKLTHLEYLTYGYHPSEAYLENPHFFNNMKKNEENELLAILSPYFPSLSRISRIECYDISNIIGKQAAGSMVVFTNGEAEKKSYRHFRIRTKDTPDDVAMIGEVIKRRLSHQEWTRPDLFVVDGGRPQLSALLAVFKALNINIPAIGLAKEYEELVIHHHGTYVKRRLARNNPALHLVQRLRDEAHRFARKYHGVLRLRSLLSK